MQGTLCALSRDYRSIARCILRPQSRHYATVQLARALDGRFLVGVRISTLNPSLILPSDFLDLSHHKSFNVSFTHSPPDGRGARLVYHQTKDLREIFPLHSRGFLYYYSDSKLSLQAGSVRLRTTTDDAVSSFHRGRDLRLPSGMPWQIIVPQIATRTIYVRLCQQLLHEGMVTEELLLRSRTVFAGRSLIYPETTVFGLQHPFLVNFQQSLSLSIVGPTRVHDAELKPFSEMAPRKLPPRPFTGSGVACFERSTLPEHARKRVILLRILKILEPVTCTVPGYTGRVGWPKEGELHTVSFRDGPQRPWSYDIDNDGGVAAALRNLFDA